LILELFVSLPLIFSALWAYRRYYKRPINDFINTLLLIADDPTIIQPVPKSLRSNDGLKKVG
ncbi:MAG: two-component sensor histidine kinase, partial [Candidatus Puniceispirillum sp.]